ncbi:uncharacterized protein C8A04DRAFT_14948 [Dichotomopilus funicola]|uniref:N-acetyltransferase ESCO zinc-finger domain-containing protein n=1 Tax=Dichotomopilus funicola TaxID=1934379 RepID=A0AAN6UWQ0_9PEZI|nr:hypothetical protein C8A04DRAFT_14948 [Dichotomopilus funicola]
MRNDQQTADPAESLEATVATRLRERKRPIRTYGRRAINPRERDQDSKQRDRVTQSCTPDLDRGDSPTQFSTFSTPTNPRSRNHLAMQSRGSILAYFKPLSSSPEKTISDAAFSDRASSPTPSSSPPSPSHTRKRRRLTTRPMLGDLGGHRGCYTLDSALDEQHGDLQINEDTIVVKAEGYDVLGSALSEVPPNTLDRSSATESSPKDEATVIKKSLGKRSARELTQTTLSLSLQKEPGFTICSVCDILYNPLNEKDRKEHNRRHAAFSRNIRRRTQ